MDNAASETMTLSPEERFRKMIPQKMELDSIIRLLSEQNISQSTLLDIGMSNPYMSKKLRGVGGVWCSVARSPAHAEEASQYLGVDVPCLYSDGTIPYEASSFNFIVVALDILAMLPDSLAFIKECHRCLKPSGMLIISAQIKRPLSILSGIRNRHWPDANDPRAAVFTEKTLYQTLKNGFDIRDVDSYSHFWIELSRIKAAKLEDAGLDAEQISATLYNRFRMAGFLDRTFSWGHRGHIITLSATRHPWTNRHVPVLSDGRTISEAVLFNPPN